MTDILVFLRELGLTVFLGGLVGLERERNQESSGARDFGGIRTMTLVAVFSYVLYAIFGRDPIVFAVFTSGFLALLVASYAFASYLNQSVGATREMSVLLVYLVGILMAKGEPVVASILTLLMVLLLHFRGALHGFARTIEKKEIYDALKFIAVTFIILPLLPNQTYGPLDVLNPHLIWLMVVLITSISFLSYIAIKAFGAKKGVGLSGFLGGLISSTAVSMSFANLSKKNSQIVNPLVFGILVAASAMFFRVLLEVSILNQDLLMHLYPPMLGMGVTGGVLALFFWLSDGGKLKTPDAKDFHMKSPYHFWPALQFGFLFALLLLLSKFMHISFGESGVYLTAFISGFVDVDAITVSMANLSLFNELDPHVAAAAITMATLSNTLVKGFIVLSFAAPSVGRRTFGSLLLILAVGAFLAFS